MVRDQMSRRKRELVGVILSFAALFLFLGFITYSPKDPCLLIREGLTRPVGNWMGPLGANLAGWLFMIMGFAAWITVPALAYAAWKFFRKPPESPVSRPRRHLALRVVGSAFLLLSASTFLHLAFNIVTVDSEPIRAGGIVGRSLGSFLHDLMGSVGSISAVVLLFILALMAAIDFSPVEAYHWVIDTAAWGRDRLDSRLTMRREAKLRHETVVKEREEMQKLRTQPEIKIVIDKKINERKPVKTSKPKQEKLPFIKEGEYELPGADLLDEIAEGANKIDQEALLMNAKILEKKLKDFGVSGEVVEIHPGPVITMYEYKPSAGVKINKITALADDLAMALSAVSVRIIAPIPGKDVVGIEISNRDRETVYFRELIESDDFARLKSQMPMALGKNTIGEPFTFDMRKAPHLLVAGSTGSGKSVSLNSMIMSVLHRSTPREVQMLMIDPKRLELSIYEGIPHLLHPVIADPKNASLALKWAVAEMERRYQLLASKGVRNLDSYNRLMFKDEKDKKKGKKKAEPEPDISSELSVSKGDTVPIDKGPPVEPPVPAEATPVLEEPTEPLPLILVIIDELADLMMVAARDIEESICRLAQMARAAGIHLIIATQRPSVDVITGLIKANFPSRVAFKVASKTDSRTILDQNGAERLLGQGDMLFVPPGTSHLMRLHGAFVSDQEIKRVTQFWKDQGEPNYEEAILKPQAGDGEAEVEEADEKYEEAIRIVVASGQASISMLQRKLKIGYNRAARIIERMEIDGLVGPSDGVSKREVLIDPMQLEQRTGS